VVGTFVKGKTENFVSPIDEKFLYNIVIARSEARDAKDGDVVNVEIKTPPISGRPPSGRIIDVLGRPEDPGVDLEIIIRKHWLPHLFSEAASFEAESIPDE